MHFSGLVLGAIAATLVAGHPGHDHHKEMLERRAIMQHTRRDLSHCAAKIKARGIEARAMKRRSNMLSHMMKKRGLGLHGRDLSSLLNTSHASSGCYTLDTPESTLFASNNSCVLSPEVTEGPYYVSGEYIRQDIVESQEGVPLTVDLQVLDVETCEPISDAYLEIWHCNSTGVYSGVSASGNGDSDSDTSNLNATFLRGVQLTDTDGAVSFETLFPGHYTGRTTHIHVMVHLNATAESNGTLLDTTASHVGQIFFDQDLITQVEATSPYSTNTQELTTNDEDSILSEEAESSDPFVEYVQLGNSIEDGLLSWIAFGVNTTLSKTVSAAATLYETGGESNPNSGLGGGGPGGAGGNGSFLSGGPSGTSPGGTAVPTAV